MPDHNHDHDAQYQLAAARRALVIWKWLATSLLMVCVGIASAYVAVSGKASAVSTLGQQVSTVAAQEAQTASSLVVVAAEVQTIERHQAVDEQKWADKFGADPPGKP